MGCLALLILAVVVVVALDQAQPGLGGEQAVAAAAWLLSQHAFWAGAIGASLAAALWVALGRHLAAAQLRRDGEARAQADYRRYGPRW